MLMTIIGVTAAAVLMIIAFWKNLTWLKNFVIGGMAVWFVVYGAAIIGFSLWSKEDHLAINQPKEFCGFYLDCHMHAQVTGVRKVKIISDKTASGNFVVINVKVFSDARNPEIRFRLLESKAELVDQNGTSFARKADAESELPSAAANLNQDIKGRETIEKEIVFDVPEQTGDLKLLLSEGYGVDKVIEAVLIDDEDSLLHKRTFFLISAPPAANFK